MHVRGPAARPWAPPDRDALREIVSHSTVHRHAEGYTSELASIGPCAEFAHVNPHTVGREHRYTYFAGATTFGNDGSYTYDAIHQYDAVRGATDSWAFDGMEVMESTFAVDPEGHDERDGWLMTTVYEPRANTGHVAVLDARRISAGPVAWIDLPHRPASAFHATWLPEAGCIPDCAVCSANTQQTANGEREVPAPNDSHLKDRAS